MAAKKATVRHDLDDFPPEIRREILEFRDRYGQTRRPPYGETAGVMSQGGTTAGKGSSSQAGPTQHVMPREDGWAVVKEGADRASRVLDTKSEAVEVAREIAQNQGAKLVIHRQDGSVQETRDYSS